MTATAPAVQSDASWLEQIHEGGLEKLLERHWNPATRVAYAIVKDSNIAEDVVQEAFLRVLRDPARFDSRRPFRPWFYRIVTNEARSQLRTSGRRLAREVAQARPILVEDSTLDDRTWVHEVLAELEPDLQLAVSLKYIDGLTFEELAQTLGCPAGTAASRVRRGMEALRGRLAPIGVLGAALPTLLASAVEAGQPAPPPAKLLANASHSLVRRKLPVWAAAAAFILSTAGLAAFGLMPPPKRSARESAARVAASPTTTVALEPEGKDTASGEARAGDERAPVARPSGPSSPRALATPVHTGVARQPIPRGTSKSGLSGRVTGPTTLEAAWVLVSKHAYGPFMYQDKFGWAPPQGAVPIAADGRFEIRHKAGDFHLIAGGRGLRTRSVPVSIDSNAWTQVNPLSLSAQAVARLRLVAQSQEPLTLSVTGMTLFQQAGRESYLQETVTLSVVPDDGGACEAWLRPGEYEISLLRPYRSRTTRVVLRADTTEVLTFDRPHLESLLVRVEDSRGFPVPNSSVQIRPFGSLGKRSHLAELAHPESAREKTDSVGTIHMNLLAGRYEVFARKGRLAGRSGVIDVPRVHEGKVVLDQVMNWGKIRLLLRAPEPIRAIGVSVRGSQYHGETAFFYLDSELPPQLDLPPGDFEIRVGVVAPGERFQRTTRKVSVAPNSTQDCHFTFSDGEGVIEGVVTGLPADVTSAPITLGASGKRVTLDETGRFKLVGLDSSQVHDLVLSVPGRMPTHFAGLKTGPERRVLECRANVRLRVLDEAGEPLRASVTLRQGDEALVTDLHTTANGELFLTHGEGAFDLEVSVRLLKADLGKWIRHPGISAYRGRVFLTPDSTLEVVLSRSVPSD